MFHNIHYVKGCYLALPTTYLYSITSSSFQIREIYSTQEAMQEERIPINKAIEEIKKFKCKYSILIAKV